MRTQAPHAIVNDFLVPIDGIKLGGYFDSRIRALTTGLYPRLDFTILEDFFRHKKDDFACGEFWGKIVRSACMVYRYTGDAGLKQTLDTTVTAMLKIQAQNGEISQSPADKQPNGGTGSDLWERKYVLLGLWHYYEIAPSQEVLDAMLKLVAYTESQVGHAPKTPITDTGWAFEGIESSSILEPIMKLYKLTGDEKCLALAHYIVEETGACRRGNIFEAVLNGTDPKDIGNNGNPAQSIAKAYEISSCFEGLLEYYRATGNEKWLKATKMYVNKVIAQEITVAGSGGADHPYNKGPGTGEQWNYTAFEQTNTGIGHMQETCVTVTWMKLLYQLFRLTGDSALMDQIEVSLCNALMGSVKADGSVFRYYSPLNGWRFFTDGFARDIGGYVLSCCTANGASGLGLIPDLAAHRLTGQGAKTTLAVNLFVAAKIPIFANGTLGALKIETDYPACNRVVFTVQKGGCFALRIRIPGWSKHTQLTVNGKAIGTQSGTYAEIDRLWQDGDTVILTLDMQPRIVLLPKLPGMPQAEEKHAAVLFGPLAMARERRVDAKYAEAVCLNELKKNAHQDWELLPKPKCGRVGLRLGDIQLIDYASAGETWEEDSAFMTWLPLC